MTSGIPLNLRQLAEISVFVSAHSGRAIDEPRLLSDGRLHDFWAHARDWVGCLLADLKQHDARRGLLPEIVLAEVFVCEILLRVWATVLLAADKRHNSNRARGVVANVMLSQMQLRHRALELIAAAREADERATASIERIRRRCERWTDVLLGHLARRYGIEHYAFDVRATRDVAAAGDADRVPLEAGADDPAWHLILAGVRVAFPDSHAAGAPHAPLSERLAQAVLLSFPARCPEPKVWLAGLAPARQRSGGR